MGNFKGEEVSKVMSFEQARRECEIEELWINHDILISEKFQELDDTDEDNEDYNELENELGGIFVIGDELDELQEQIYEFDDETFSLKIKNIYSRIGELEQ